MTKILLAGGPSAGETMDVADSDWGDGAERLVIKVLVKGPPCTSVYLRQGGTATFVEQMTDPVILPDSRVVEGEAWPEGTDLVIDGMVWTRRGTTALQGASVVDPVSIWSGPLEGRIVSGEGWPQGEDRFFPLHPEDKVQSWHYRRTDSDDGAIFLGLSIGEAQ